MSNKWQIRNGCYEADMHIVDGHISLGVTCPVIRGPIGHYIKVETDQAIALCRFLCDNVPGVADAILGKLTEL